MSSLSEITNCPNCKGWGTEQIPIRKGFKTCPECFGFGLQMDNGYYFLYFGMPTFVAFKKRRLMQLAKISFVTTLMLLILFIIVFTLFLAKGNIT